MSSDWRRGTGEEQNPIRGSLGGSLIGKRLLGGRHCGGILRGVLLEAARLSQVRLLRLIGYRIHLLSDDHAFLCFSSKN